jgi:hypothetical protein
VIGKLSAIIKSPVKLAKAAWGMFIRQRNRFLPAAIKVLSEKFANDADRVAKFQ